MSQDLGKAFKILRKQCNLTQKQVAEALHINRSTYAYYESGATEPDLKSISKLAKIFNVDVNDLLPNSDGKINICLRDVTGTESEEIPEDEAEKLDIRNEKIYLLSKEERGFIAWFRTLTDEQKAKLKENVTDED